MTTMEADNPENRLRMVNSQLVSRGISDRRVLDVMAAVPRERFLESGLFAEAYRDGPLPIGHGQTISQPYIVAYMCQLLRIEAHHRVLEVGAGCGYQAAILARLAARVITLERIQALADRASETLQEEIVGGRIRVVCADGAFGFADEAPFDRIIVSAAIPGLEPPPVLWSQLKEGGIMVAPMGKDRQYIYVISKKEGGMERRQDLAVSFVPFISDVL
jgi:protein-L-isoaspartate(D-aspartate) O-methyltransferase